MGWARTFKYLRHRVLRLPSSTASIALGLASGCVVSWTPTFPFQILQCFIFCKIAKVNFPAALLGTTFGNPWTFPILFIISYNVGILFLTLIGYDMDLNIQTDKNVFLGIFETLEVVLITTAEKVGNYLLALIGVMKFFHFNFSVETLNDSYEYFNKVIIPTIIGGYIMALLTMPLFYYIFFYLITAGRAARVKVSAKVHDIIDHRKEKQNK